MTEARVLAGRYRLDAVLGAGGMSVVYRARDLRLDRDVAVKILAPNLAADPIVARRFGAEARIVAAIAHPNLVRIHDVGEDRGDPFYVMELIDGETLEARLQREPEPTLAEVAALVEQVAAGLGALHARRLVHRDVKPANILVGTDGVPRVADFGLVRGEATGNTAPGIAVGTLAYLAPELLRGEDATPASDTFALAAVAYRAITGAFPYRARTIAELVEAQSRPPMPASIVRPDVGLAIDEVLARGLGDSVARPAPTEFAAGFSAAISGATVATGTTRFMNVATPAAALLSTSARSSRTVRVSAFRGVAIAVGALLGAALFAAAALPGGSRALVGPATTARSQVAEVLPSGILAPSSPTRAPGATPVPSERPASPPLTPRPTTPATPDVVLTYLGQTPTQAPPQPTATPTPSPTPATNPPKHHWHQHKHKAKHHDRGGHGHKHGHGHSDGHGNGNGHGDGNGQGGGHGDGGGGGGGD